VICLPRLTITDRANEQPGLVKVRKLEARYARDLRKISRQVGDLIKGVAPDGVLDAVQAEALRILLGRYAEAIEPWARATAGRMIAEIGIKERKAWADHARLMGRELRREIMEAPTGRVMREALAEQVKLIKSLPTEAAERVHRLTIEGIQNGTRASEIAREIMRSGEVTQSRANLIARTEVARTSSALTQARAEHAGSTTYIWRTAHDSDVRPSHRKMEGAAIRWDQPPTLDGLTGHAGMLPNCRCYAEPVFPDFE
jgi:SPP1 gp7 family putative phage head morphogenesis protein